MKKSLLFDASSIHQLIRELQEDAPNELLKGSTIPLSYYELGNAVWRECTLLKRITHEEAKKLMISFYLILQAMKITPQNEKSEGINVLQTACQFNLTFYDSAYLNEAKKAKKTLVTEDKKLAKAAENAGIETLTSKAFTK
jgi:predicted nucleic acid-binding protein